MRVSVTVRGVVRGRGYHGRWSVDSECQGKAKGNASVWNSLLRMHSTHGLPQSVLRCFASFLNSGHSPDQFTFAITLSACAKLHNVELGRAVHCCIIKRGIQSASFCHGALIHLYVNSHSLTSARTLFD
ncbi:hypothetical protein VIGAN_UM037700, partial [Vigna angularis var. angularis]